MSEFVGEVVRLGNPEVKIRVLLQSIHRLEDSNRALKSQLEEKDRLLAERDERIKRIIREHVEEGRKKSKKPRGKGPQIRKNFIPPSLLNSRLETGG